MSLILLKGLRIYKDYIQSYGDPEREGEDLIRNLTPFISIMPDKTVRLAHSSLKEFLLEPDEGDKDVLDFTSKNSRFKIIRPPLYCGVVFGNMSFIRSLQR